MQSKSFSSRKSGFTIIELLVVIVIIGILAALAATKFTTAQLYARDNARKAQVSSLANAVEAYYGANRVFPGKVVTDSSVPNPSYKNCEGVDGNNNYTYYYFPFSASAGDSTKNTSCDQRGSDPVFKASFTPNPTWIPGLGNYLNPMPIELKYQGVDGGSLSDYADELKAADGSGNQTRTFVYQHLTGGYLIYTRLEASSQDAIDFSNTTVKVNDPNDPPYLPNSTPTGKYIYLIRK